MRGYLERLAASAMRPERAVHPFVSTLFSGARQKGIVEETLETRKPALRVERSAAPDGNDIIRENAPLDPTELPEQAANAERRVESTIPMLPRERATSAEMQEDVRSAQSLRGPARADEPHPVELLLPRHPIEPETPERKAQVEARAMQSEDARAAQRALEATFEPAPTEPLSLRVQPLLVEEWTASARREEVLPERPPRDEAQRTNPAAWTVAAKRRLGAERMPLEVGREHQRGSDDIQIHIGRIEIVAVPPAPARSAAPTRKSQTLDEYLKRRDGRAR